MTFTKRIALAGITAAAALVCSNAAQAQQECVDSFVVAGSNDTGPCWTDGSGYFDISWTGGCLATNINYSGGDIDITANGFTEGFVFFGFDPGACETITITFEDGSIAGGVEVCNDCVPAECGNGVCEAGEDSTTCPEDCTAGECPAGQVADCDGSGECWTEAWIADGFCDGTAQQYGADLCCYDNDGGDCTEEECAPIAGACCTDGACTEVLPDDCEANGGTFVGGSCEAFPCGSEYEDCGDPAAGSCFEENGSAGCDNEICCATVCEVDDACCLAEWDAICVEYANQFCNPNQGNCAAGEVEDCDGSGECWTEAWVGDGYCDGTAQQYGADLCCIDNDGGDCTEEECTPNVCGDGECSPGETAESCPEDCNASDCLTVTGTSGETDNDGDGNPDDCFTDPNTGAGTGYVVLEWEGGCTASTIEFVGLGTLGPGAYASGVLVYGLGDEPICYDIIVTFDDGSVADTINVCTVCGDPAVCGDGVCSASESFDTCPEDCEKGGCPTGEVADCDGSGECWTEAWIADGFCDGTAQQYGADLCCYELDGGDCTAEECAEASCGDGVCGADETIDSCPEDCDVPCGAGEVADCDGSGQCWTETWIGDGYCDGTAQQYDADLCCYDGGTPGAFDGGDCTAEECGGAGDPTGACCVGDTCSISTEADCSGEWQGADTACDTDTCGSDCPGDFNGDGEIGGGDLTILLAAWGTDDPAIDLNDDGIIGGGDLTILLAAWGTQCGG